MIQGSRSGESGGRPVSGCQRQHSSCDGVAPGYWGEWRGPVEAADASQMAIQAISVQALLPDAAQHTVHQIFTNCQRLEALAARRQHGLIDGS